MEVLKLLPKTVMNYPVGHYMRVNLPIIKEMAQWIYLTILENYDPTGQILVYLVCRGSSGSIISGIVLSELMSFGMNNVHIYYVRKENEKTHYQGCPLSLDDSVIVVVDDFIATGQTIYYIKKNIEEGIGHPRKIDIICVSGDVHISGLNTNYLICGQDKD